MTSSSKKRKKKKADFQKVKLKVGRKLPKGLNETKTTFQTRKIQIREQLKGDVVEQSTPGKRNLEDLLSSLKHKNKISRQFAIFGIRDLVNGNEQKMTTNLNGIVSAIAKLIEDRAKEIRNVAHATLKIILSRTNMNEISPSFPLLSAYLCCGMTHVDPDIQRDSLLFLDLLLDYFPDLLVEMNPKILSNFLNQISRQSHNSLTNRTLIINPESRMTGSEWRLQVFHRVEKFLRAILNNHKKTNLSKSAESLNVVANETLVYQNIPHPTSFYNSQFPCNWHKMSRSATRLQKKNIIEDLQEFRSFLCSFLPLLLETWMETRPEKKIKNSQETIISPEMMETLHCVVEILKLVLSCVECFEKAEEQEEMLAVFRNSFLKGFLEYFMTYFPYLCLNTPSKNKKKIDYKVFCCNTNLSLCFIFFKLSSNGPEMDNGIWNAIVNYMSSFLENSNSFDTCILNHVLKTIFRQKNCTDLTENVLDGLLKSFKDENCSKKKKISLVEIFYTALTDSSQLTVTSKTLNEWLLHFPSLLQNDEFFPQIISYIHRIASRGNKVLLIGLQQHKDNLLDLIVSIRDDKSLKVTLEVLLYLENLSEIDYEKLEKFVTNSSVTISIRCYCVEILNLRYQRIARDMKILSVTCFVQFLLRLAIGTRFNKSDDCEKSLPLSLNIISSDVDDNWNFQKKILETVCSIIDEFENHSEIIELIFISLKDFLDEATQLHLISAWSILKVIDKLSFLVPLVMQLEDKFMEFLFATIFAEFMIDKKCETTKNIGTKISILNRLLKILKRVSALSVKERHASNICLMLSKIINEWKLGEGALEKLEETLKSFNKRFGFSFRESDGFIALTYELSLKKKEPLSMEM